MVFQTLLLGLGRSYLAGAATGWRSVAAFGYSQVGDFNLAKITRGDTKAEIELTDLVALERELRTVAPDLYNKFKRDARRIGTPARDSVRKAFLNVGASGPLGPRKVNPSKPWATAKAIQGRTYDGFNTKNGDNGRLSWTLNYNMISKNQGIDVNYKNRNANKDLSKLKTGQDGQLSIVRVRVRRAPLILADMAGRKRTAMYSQGKGRTRPYEIDLFGRGIVTRTHIINRDNSDTFVDNLMRAKNSLSTKASRYAWPAFEKHQPAFRADVDKLLQEAVVAINRRLES